MAVSTNWRLNLKLESEVFYCRDCSKNKPDADKVRLKKYRYTCKACHDKMISRKTWVQADRDLTETPYKKEVS